VRHYDSSRRTLAGSADPSGGDHCGLGLVAAGSPRREEESGLAAAQKAEDDAWQACTAVLFEIREVPATTLADMALKARFIVDAFGCFDDLMLLIDEPSD
jgi:hypothetical protein